MFGGAAVRRSSRLAEREGFEPSKVLRPCRFSRPVHSTALPPLPLISRLSSPFARPSPGPRSIIRNHSFVAVDRAAPAAPSFLRGVHPVLPAAAALRSWLWRSPARVARPASVAKLLCEIDCSDAATHKLGRALCGADVGSAGERRSTRCHRASVTARSRSNTKPPRKRRCQQSPSTSIMSGHQLSGEPAISA